MIKKLNPKVLYTFISNLSAKERVFFYAATVIVSLALLDRLVIYPFYSKMQSLDEDIKKEEESILNDMRAVAQEDRIEEEKKKYATFFIKGRSEEEEMTALLKDIENIANQSEVYIVDMKPAGVSEEGSTKKYNVNLVCEAAMEQIGEFMYNIDSSGKILVIEKYQINPKARGSEVATCSISLAKFVMP